MAALGARRIAGIDVGWVALGGAAWSVPKGIDTRLAARTIHAAIEAGVWPIDTAHAYTTREAEAHNERLITLALRDAPVAKMLIRRANRPMTRCFQTAAIEV